MDAPPSCFDQLTPVPAGIPIQSLPMQKENSYVHSGSRPRSPQAGTTAAITWVTRDRDSLSRACKRKITLFFQANDTLR